MEKTKQPEVRSDPNAPGAVTDDGYDTLRAVYARAVEQASRGKGKERHALEGEPFEEQQIVELNERIGSNHGAIFQACKKATESCRLPRERAVAELLGAMNYLAAAVLVLERDRGVRTLLGGPRCPNPACKVIRSHTADECSNAYGPLDGR